MMNIHSTGSGFTKVAVSQDCKDKNTYKGYKKTPEECSQACFGSSTVFVFGKTNKRCSSSGCKCYCIHAPKDGKCQQYSHSYYDIYRFNGKSGPHLEYYILMVGQGI